MPFLIEVTFPLHEKVSCSEEYKPKRFTAADEEEAVQVFQRAAEHPKGFDPNKGVEDLSKRIPLEAEDRETGRTVTAKWIDDACVRCRRDHGKVDPGWSLVKSGFLCPDCTVAVCPDDALVLGKVAS